MGLFGCGGGETGQSDVPVQGNFNTTEASAVRAQVDDRCLNTGSDFCTRAYLIIADWISGRLTDEEFVDRIVALRADETAGEQEQETASGREVDPLDYDCTPKLRRTSGEPFDYDPAWEDQVNARERAVYRGEEATTTAPVNENIRIYSYGPDGQSYENTFEVLSKLFCELTRAPSFHGVVLQEFRDGRGTYAGYFGRADGNVVLFFKEALVPAILELYGEMTYSQIREHLKANQNYDFLGNTYFADIRFGIENVSDWNSISQSASFSWSFTSCQDLPGNCLPWGKGGSRYGDWIIRNRSSLYPDLSEIGKSMQEIIKPPAD